jgi:23S rRNA (uracil1939-C5)-methyltransferase
LENTEVTIEKLVHGGQGLATMFNGKKVFVWGALPGERVSVRVFKSKKGHAEAIVESVIDPSPHREVPKDEAYLSTSPWQIMTFEAENSHKQSILAETMQREKVAYDKPIEFKAGDNQWHYRNKMEYSFWGDEDGLHLALFNRGTHSKRIITHSSIARPEIDEAANKICAILKSKGIRGSQLKTVVVRCSQKGETVAALFVKTEKFPNIEELGAVCKGLAVYYSNPKSPASIVTKELYVYGDIKLSDKIMGADIGYDVNSFFQVNLPVFELAAKQIEHFTKGMKPKVDFYSGVGTIGLPVKASVLVESDMHSINMARKNAEGHKVEVVHAPAETALNYITPEGALIVDPPRAGLHARVTEKILESKPPLVAYLSCNPITQARDLAILQAGYSIKSIEGYNFFPRTPHIESLAVMIRK